MESLTRVDVSNFLELRSDSRSNGIHPLVPLNISESKSDSLEMMQVPSDSLNTVRLRISSGISKTDHTQISVVDVINSDDECLQNNEYKTGTNSEVTNKVTSFKNVPTDLSVRNVVCDSVGKKLKESEKQPFEVINQHHDIGDDHSLFSLSNHLVALSSDSSLDTDEDLEDALLKANLTRIHHLNGGRRIVTRRSPRLSKVDPVTTIVCTRIHKNMSNKKKCSSKSVAKEAVSEVTSVTSDSNFNRQCSKTDVDKASSDDSVICLDNDGDDDNEVESNKTRDKEKSIGNKLYSANLNTNFGVYPRFNIGPGVSSFYHIVTPPKPASSSSSVLKSVKTLSGSNIPFSASRVILSSSNMTLYSSAVQMTSARINTSAPCQELKSVFVDKGIDNLLPNCTGNAESRPVAKLLCEIGSIFVNRYLSNNTTLHRRQKRSSSAMTVSNNDSVEAIVEQIICPDADQVMTNDFNLMTKRCCCGFATESKNVLQLHYELGRESSGLQHCCLCDDYSARYSSQFVRHMELEHDRKVRIPLKPSTYLCQLCTFETNGRAVYEKHVRNCQRLFSVKSNQRPNPNDCDIPILNTDIRSETLSFGGDVVPKRTVIAQTEPSIAKSASISSEPKLLRIGNQLFVLMSKPAENTASTNTITQSSSRLGLMNCEKVPQTAVATSVKCRGFSPSFLQRSHDKLTFPSVSTESVVTPVLPMSSEMPLSTRTISPNSTWVSHLAAAAAKSVLSRKPAPSKAAAPQVKTLTTSVSTSSVEVSCASQSSVVIKAVVQRTSDMVITSAPMNMTALHTSSSASVSVDRCSPVSNIQGIPSTNISKPTAFHQLSLAATALSKLRLANDAADQQLQMKNLMKETRDLSQDPFVICPLCNGFVKDFECLETHLSVCHKTADTSLLASIRCSQCIPAKYFPTAEAMHKHEMECHCDPSDNSLGCCSHCKMLGIDDILAHAKEKHNVTLLSMYNSQYCFLCCCLFESAKAFETHMIGSHKNLCPDIVDLRKKIYCPDSRMICPVCGKKNLFNLVRHMENRHNITSSEMLQLLFCNFCSYHLQDALDFESHMLECHTDLFPSRDYLWNEIFAKQKSSGFSDPSDGFGGTFKCSLCDDEFVSPSYRYRHEMMSHPHLPIVCSLCKKNFDTDEALASHQKITHLDLCTLPLKQLNSDKLMQCNSSNGNNSPKSVNVCSSPETVVITDEEEQTGEPLAKHPRLEYNRDSDNEKIIPPENIEEVLEIDGETIIIVQERD